MKPWGAGRRGQARARAALAAASKPAVAPPQPNDATTINLFGVFFGFFADLSTAI